MEQISGIYATTHSFGRVRSLSHPRQSLQLGTPFHCRIVESRSVADRSRKAVL